MMMMLKDEGAEQMMVIGSAVLFFSLDYTRYITCSCSALCHMSRFHL
jgi:hypothetical protein